MEKIGEFISNPEGKGVKKTSVVLNYRGESRAGKTEPGHDSDIRIFSWDQSVHGKHGFMMTDTKLIIEAASNPVIMMTLHPIYR